MSESYPKRNPFPYQGTLSIEGTQIDSEADSPSSRLLTLKLDAVLQTLELARAYLKRFRPSEKSQGQERSTGQFVLLCGEHGSGKTHTIQFAMGKVANSEPQPFQIYAKAEGTDFLELYRKIMIQIPLTVLIDLSLRFLGVVTSEQVETELKNSTEGERVTQALQENPQQIFHLFQSYLIEEGEIQQSQAEEIKILTEGRKDFYHALSYLTTTLAPTAYKWLLGDSCIGTDGIRQLGVSGPITSNETAKLALQLLVTLFCRVGRPFILYIDQYEKLVLCEETKTSNQNIGKLQSLVETIPKQNGMLVLSGNQEAWIALPLDFRQRFAYHIVKFSILTLEEAKQLIKLYLTPRDQPFERECSEEDIQPFTIDAIRQMLSYGAGNIRRLLQSCSATYDAFLEQKTESIITSSLVKETFSKRSLPYPDHDIVAREIQKTLVGRSLQFQSGSFRGILIDFAVLLEDGKALLIEISEALFVQDEVENALRNLERVQQLRELLSPVQIILIVLGYVSPEITEKIYEVVDESLVYKPETFPSLFEEILERSIVKIKTNIETPKSRSVEDLQLSELKSSLEQLQQSRRADIQSLEDRFIQLLQQQTTERVASQRNEIQSDWAMERSRIEERIQDARIERQDLELEALERLRSSAEESNIAVISLMKYSYNIMLSIYTPYETLLPRLSSKSRRGL